MNPEDSLSSHSQCSFCSIYRTRPLVAEAQFLLCNISGGGGRAITTTKTWIAFRWLSALSSENCRLYLLLLVSMVSSCTMFIHGYSEKNSYGLQQTVKSIMAQNKQETDTLQNQVSHCRTLLLSFLYVGNIEQLGMHKLGPTLVPHPQRKEHSKKNGTGF